MQGAHRHNASLAQLVEQLTLNQFVRGSSPRGGTQFCMRGEGMTWMTGLPSVFLLRMPSRRAFVVFADTRSSLNLHLQNNGGTYCFFV